MTLEQLQAIKEAAMKANVDQPPGIDLIEEYLLKCNPKSVLEMITAIEKMREALQRIKNHGCCVMHNDSSCPGCDAHFSLKELGLE